MFIFGGSVLVFVWDVLSEGGLDGVEVGAVAEAEIFADEPSAAGSIVMLFDDILYFYTIEIIQISKHFYMTFDIIFYESTTPRLPYCLRLV